MKCEKKIEISLKSNSYDSHLVHLKRAYRQAKKGLRFGIEAISILLSQTFEVQLIMITILMIRRRIC